MASTQANHCDIYIQAKENLLSAPGTIPEFVGDALVFHKPEHSVIPTVRASINTWNANEQRSKSIVIGLKPRLSTETLRRLSTPRNRSIKDGTQAAPKTAINKETLSHKTVAAAAPSVVDKTKKSTQGLDNLSSKTLPHRTMEQKARQEIITSESIDSGLKHPTMDTYSNVKNAAVAGASAANTAGESLTTSEKLQVGLHSLRDSPIAELQRLHAEELSHSEELNKLKRYKELALINAETYQQELATVKETLEEIGHGETTPVIREGGPEAQNQLMEGIAIRNEHLWELTGRITHLERSSADLRHENCILRTLSKHSDITLERKNAENERLEYILKQVHAKAAADSVTQQQKLQILTSTNKKHVEHLSTVDEVLKKLHKYEFEESIDKSKLQELRYALDFIAKKSDMQMIQQHLKRLCKRKEFEKDPDLARYQGLKDVLERLVDDRNRFAKQVKALSEGRTIDFKNFRAALDEHIHADPRFKSLREKLHDQVLAMLELFHEHNMDTMLQNGIHPHVISATSSYSDRVKHIALATLQSSVACPTELAGNDFPALDRLSLSNGSWVSCEGSDALMEPNGIDEGEL